LKGRSKVSMEDKLDVLSIIEASPIRKSKAIAMFEMAPVKYYRWQLKYYLDNCLDDKRGRYERRAIRIEDLYRKQIIDIRKTGIYGKYVIGPETIMGRLEDQGIFISHETIRNILHQEGLIEPRPKAPRHEYKRFEAEYANQLWQMDILHAFVCGYGYYYLFSILDDYSRRIMHWELFPLATGKEAVYTLRTAMEIHKVKPEKKLTDRGAQFYSGEGKRYGYFEKFLEQEEIQHVLARVKHPQTLGKIERYHRTLRQMCLNLQEFNDPMELKRAIRIFVDEYNFRRKHKGINRVTPYQRYSGEDKEIIRVREELKRKVISERRSGVYNEALLRQEVACREVIASLKKSYAKEVVVV
jgi:putative transposase